MTNHLACPAGFREIDNFVTRLCDQGIALPSASGEYPDRRASDRYDVILSTTVHNAEVNVDAAPQICESRDISRDGLSFLSRTQVLVGDQLIVRVDDGLGNSIRAMAYVRHCTPYRKRYRVGALFIFDDA